MVSSILGIGTDIVQISRIKKLNELYGLRFLQRVFTQAEIEFAFQRANPYPHLASAFATKEAFYKSLGGYSPFKFTEISLERTSRGPRIHLTGYAEEIFRKRGGKKIHLSISHNGDYTISIILLEG